MRRLAFMSATVCAITGSMLLSARAALPPRIAIISSPNDDVIRSDADRFAARLGHGILKHPRYQLVTRDRLDAMLREQGLSNSAYADPATAARLGRIVGASHILHVTLSIDVERSSGLMEHEKYEVSSDYELIEVSTARITSNGSSDGSTDRTASGGGDFTESALGVRREAIDACAEDLVGQLNLQ